MKKSKGKLSGKPIRRIVWAMKVSDCKNFYRPKWDGEILVPEPLRV